MSGTNGNVYLFATTKNRVGIVEDGLLGQQFSAVYVITLNNVGHLGPMKNAEVLIE